MTFACNMVSRSYRDHCVPAVELTVLRLQQRSLATAHEVFPMKDGCLWIRLVNAIFQFALSYTDWLCYAMFVVKFAVHPSVLTLLPPLTIFTYALLVEAPAKFYWGAMLFWFQMLIVVGALLTMLDGSNPVLVFFEQYGILHTVEQDPTDSLLFDLATLLCINVHRNEMLKYRIPAETATEATPLLDGAARSGSSGTSPFNLQVGSSPIRQSVHTMQGWMEDLLHRRRVGRDLYFRSFVTAMFGFVVLLFSFDSIVGHSQDFLSSLQNNLLPGSLVLTLFSYFLAMVLDRVCYLVRSPRLKMIWHFTVVTLVFGVAYVYLVLRRQAQWQLQLFLCVTLTWLSFSALQLYWGYPQTMGSSWLVEGYHPYRHLLYITYRAIPFVYEMKSLLDWTCAATTLKMNEWLKLEDIHHELILARADREDTILKARPRGTAFPLRLKLNTGCVMFVLLCVLIFFPLMYYSSFSPALAPNNINATQVAIQFPGAPAVFEGRTTSSLPGDVPTDEESEAMSAALTATRPGLTDTLQDKYVQVLSFSDYSFTNWGISPPVLRQLLTALKSEPTELEIRATFTRSRGLGGPDFVVLQNYTLDSATRERMRRGIEDANHTEVMLPSFYCPFIVNRPLSIAPLAAGPGTKWMQDCKLAYERSQGVGFWQLRCRGLFRNGNAPEFATGAERACLLSGGFRCGALDYSGATANRDHKWVPLYFVAMSAEVPKRSGLGGLFQSFSIIAIYSTFVLAAGRVIRLMLTGSAQRVVLEDMKNPGPLICLVEDVKLARAEGELALEEDLYEELINIYRSPELIKQWTAAP